MGNIPPTPPDECLQSKQYCLDHGVRPLLDRIPSLSRAGNMAGASCAAACFSPAVGSTQR
eukprot:2163920-Amphidinium_carterae.1